MKLITHSKTLVYSLVIALLLSCTTPIFATSSPETPRMDYLAPTEPTSILNLTQEEVTNLFNDFIANRTPTLSTEHSLSSDVLNEFVQYTVNEGIIEDTLEQRAAMTKAGYRAMFTIVVTCGNEAGLYTAANLLDHSLQDVPGNFVKGSSTGYAIQIVQSDEMQSIIEDFKDYVSGKNLSARTISGSIALDSTLDLYLAYNLVDYVISGTNSNGEWDLTIRITDEYDFDPVAWEDGVAEYSDAVGILVDHAVDAQAVGAIVPYNIMITGKTSFTE